MAKKLHFKQQEEKKQQEQMQSVKAGAFNSVSYFYIRWSQEWWLPEEWECSQAMEANQAWCPIWEGSSPEFNHSQHFQATLLLIFSIVLRLEGEVWLEVGEWLQEWLQAWAVEWLQEWAVEWLQEWELDLELSQCLVEWE